MRRNFKSTTLVSRFRSSQALAVHSVANFRRSRRLTQFWCRVKKPRVLHERVAVGHAGDEIGDVAQARGRIAAVDDLCPFRRQRSEEHTSELQSQSNLVCRLLLEKKNSSATRTRTSASH